MPLFKDIEWVFEMLRTRVPQGSIAVDDENIMIYGKNGQFVKLFGLCETILILYCNKDECTDEYNQCEPPCEHTEYWELCDPESTMQIAKKIKQLHRRKK